MESAPFFLDNAVRFHCPIDQAYEYRTDVCNYCVYQLLLHTLAVKWLCDASRARAPDDSIGDPQMLKFLNALAVLAVRTVDGICAESANKNARG